MTSTSPWEPWLDPYLAYLADVQRLARGTVRDVRCSLKRLASRLDELLPETPLWEAPLPAFLAWLEGERRQGTAAPTLAKYLSHARGFLDYAFRSGRCQRNVLDGFTLQDARRPVKPRCLSLEEAQRLVAACPARHADQRRERLIVLLLYGCGLRTNELCTLKTQDVDRQRQELIIRHGKGDRERTIPIPQAVYTELLAYLAERGVPRGLLLRKGARGQAVPAAEVGRIVRQAVQRAGLGGAITPKTLRHTFATHLMDRGVDLAVISSLMGHRSPQETGVYLHVLGDASAAAVERLPAPGPDAERQAVERLAVERLEAATDLEEGSAP